MREIDRYRSIAHPLLAICLSLSFFIPLSLFFFDIIGREAGNPLVTIAILVVLSFITAITNNILYKESFGFLKSLKIMLPCIALIYFFLSLQKGLPLRESLSLGWANFLPTLFSFFLYYSVSYLQSSLRDRENMMEAVEGLSGESLQKALREHSLTCDFSVNNFSGIRSFCSGATLGLVAMLTLSAVFQIKIELVTILACIPAFALIPYVRFIGAQYRREQFIFAEGMVYAKATRNARLRVALCIVALCFSLSTLVSGESSVLSNAWLGDVANFFSPNIRPTMPTPAPTTSAKNALTPGNLKKMKREVDMTFIGNAIRGVFIAAAALIVLYIFVGPLVSRRFRRYLREKSLFRFLIRRIRELIDLLFGRGKRKRLDAETDASISKLKRKLERMGSPRKSEEKRKEIGFFVKEFLKLVRWGSAKGIGYPSSMAPREYSSLIEARWPAIKPECALAGDMVEEALYSNFLLPRERFSEYKLAIERILKYDTKAATQEARI